MATLLELHAQGRVFRIDPALGWREFEARKLFVLPDARNWIEEVLPAKVSTWNIQESPVEHL
jgi:hypothetical protein